MGTCGCFPSPPSVPFLSDNATTSFQNPRCVTRATLLRITELAIQTISTSNLLIQAFQIAVDYDRSFYDSLYVALALTAKTQLITADERLVKALGSRFPIRWLGTF